MSVFTSNVANSSHVIRRGLWYLFWVTSCQLSFLTC